MHGTSSSCSPSDPCALLCIVLLVSDTVVRPFDPRSIDAECFGGHERIEQFAANGRATMQTVEKSRNAYLLFYTRRNKRAGDSVSPVAAAVSPPSPSSAAQLASLKASIPPAIFESVQHSNRTYWHDRYVFDAMYAEFVYQLLQHAARWTSHMQVTDASQAQQVGEAWDAVLQLGTRFVLETLCHSRQKSHLWEWSQLLAGGYKRSPVTCRWLLHSMTESSVWSQQLLLSCPLPKVRQGVASLLKTVIDVLGPTEEADMQQRAATPVNTLAEVAPISSASSSLPVCDFIDALLRLLPVVPEWWRRFNEYFSVLAHFTRCTPSASVYLLQRHNLLARLCDLYVAAPENIFQMPLKDGKRVIVGDTLIRPDTTAFLALLANLICASAVQKAGVQPPAPVPALVPLSPEASQLLFSKTVLSRLLTDATSRRRGEHLGTLLTHLLWENMELSKIVIGLLVSGIKTEQADSMRPYMRDVGALLQIADSLQTMRQDVLLQSLLLVIEQHGSVWMPMSFLIEHLIRLCKQHPAALHWMQAHPANCDNLIHWLKQHSVPPRQGEPTLMHKVSGTLRSLASALARSFSCYFLTSFRFSFACVSLVSRVAWIPLSI